MIPILYEKNEKQFLTYGLGEVAFIKAKVTRVRNGEYTFEGEYPINGIHAKELQVGRFIKANAGYRTKFQTFEIARVIKDSNNKLVVYANHISYQLLYDVLERDVNISSTSADGALTIWKNNLITDMQWDVWSDIGSTNSTTLNVRNMTNGRLALVGKAGSIIDTWGGELEFDNTTIKLHKQYGRKYPTTIEYGKNLISAEVEEDIMSTYTSVRSYAVKFTNEEENSNEEIYFLEKQFIDSEHVDKYSHRRVLLIDVSSSFKQEEEITQEKLEKLANDYIKNNRVGIPKTKIKLKYLDLSKTLDYQDYKRMEEVELCDIVPVYYSNIGLLDSEAKVNEVVYDVLLERNESVDVGVIGKSYSQTVLDNMVSMVENLESKTNSLDSIPYLLNGMGNRIWFSTPNPNMEHKVDDIWFEQNGKYERTYRWNGEMWEKISDTETDVLELQMKFQKLDQQTEQLNQHIAESEKRIQTELAKVGTLSDNAKKASDNALTRFDEFNTQLTQARATAEETLKNALNVVNRADGIVSDSQTLLNQAALAKQEATNSISEAVRLLEQNGVVAGNLTAYKQEVANLMKGYVKEGAYNTETQKLNNRVNEWERTVEGYTNRLTEIQTQNSIRDYDNLILNGYGLANSNYNFEDLVFDAEVDFDGYPSFRSDRTQTFTTTSYIPIDVDSAYKLSFHAKSSVATKMLAGLSPYDADHQFISPSMSMFIPKTTTSLAKDLNPGDSKIYLKSTDNWIHPKSGYQRGVIFWNYRDSTGYVYPKETYSRNVYSNLWNNDSDINRTDNSITLNRPWSGPSYPEGTELSQSSSGSSYIYISIGTGLIDTEFRQFSNTIQGVYTTGKRPMNQFPPGIKYAKIMFLINYSRIPDAKVWLSKLYFGKVSQESLDLRRFESEYNRTSKEVTDKLSELTQKSDSLENSSNELIRTSQQTKERLTLVESSNNHLTTKVNETTRTVDGLKTNVEAYKESADTVSSQLAEYTQAVNGQSAKLQEYKQSNDTLKAQVASYEQMVEGVRSSISEVEAKIPKEIGTFNYLKYNSVFWMDANNNSLSPLEREWVDIETQAFSLMPTKNSWISTYSHIQTETRNDWLSWGTLEGKFTWSFEVENISDIPINVSIYRTNEYKLLEIGSKTRLYQYLDIKKGANKRMQGLITREKDLLGKTLIVSKPMLVKGHIKTDYIPPMGVYLKNTDFTQYKNEQERTAREYRDRLTALDGDNGKINELIRTADSLRQSLSAKTELSTVQNLIAVSAEGLTREMSRVEQLMADRASKTEFQTVNEKVNFYERLIGTSSSEASAKTAISRMVMTSDAFQTEVSNLSRSKNLITYVEPGFLSNRNGNEVTNSNWTRTGWIDVKKLQNERIVSSDNGEAASINKAFYDENKTFIQAVGGSIATVPRNAHYMRLYYSGDMSRKVQVEKGRVPTSYEEPSQNGISTKVNQLADSWAVKTLNEKGDLIAQINQTNGLTKFKNDLFEFDGTVKMNDAFAKKLLTETTETNTLRAFAANINKLNVIEVNASKITGDLGRFLRLLLNGEHSNVKLDGRDLTITRNDGSYATRFHDNGIELYRDGNIIGSIVSLDAMDTYGFYNNKRSISITARKDNYVGFSYYSEQDRKYYRAVGLGGDGRLRFHSPLYAGVSNHGFEIKKVTIANKPSTCLEDTVSKGSVIISNDRDVWLSITSGNYVSITNIWNMIKEMRAKIQSAERQIQTLSQKNSTVPTYTPPSYTPPAPKPVNTTIGVGDLVRIRSGQTTYWDQDDRIVTIPTYLHGRNYRTLTYNIGYIATNGKIAKYRLDYEGWAIAWAKPEILEKL